MAPMSGHMYVLGEAAYAFLLGIYLGGLWRHRAYIPSAFVDSQAVSHSVMPAPLRVIRPEVR